MYEPPTVEVDQIQDADEWGHHAVTVPYHLIADLIPGGLVIFKDRNQAFYVGRVLRIVEPVVYVDLI